MTDLSVVLISKNQEWSIARLIESVIHETEIISSKEIVLVDSASTDRTTNIASGYPIDVLRLQPNQRLTPAAGRYIGYNHTTGNLVLFLDGDMELYPGWLEKALGFIQSSPATAVVTGQFIDLPKTTEFAHAASQVNTTQDSFSEVRQGGGAAMYRRSVLEEVGSFNPYLYSEEEPELCIRIRHAGYRVVQLNHPIAYHYSDSKAMLSTVVQRWKRNLYLGPGQILRYHPRGGILWLYLRERGWGCAPTLGLLVGWISWGWSLYSGQWLWFDLWLAMLAGIIVGDAFRKRSLYQTIVSLFKRACVVDGTIRGFLMQAPRPDTYPGKLDTIKPANQNLPAPRM